MEESDSKRVAANQGRIMLDCGKFVTAPKDDTEEDSDDNEEFSFEQ